MHIHNISQQNSILNTYISEIRSKSIQKDSMRFRRNIERIGEILGYEMSKTLSYKVSNVETPLGSSKIALPENDIVLCSILRAGIPLHNGLLNYFDTAENAFISAYRHHKHNPESFEIIVEYLACPSLKNKTLILVDPMLATGHSSAAAVSRLKENGASNIRFVSLLAAPEGIEYFHSEHPDVPIYTAAVDEKLNDHAYILPGLGDAGDRIFGTK